MQQYDSFLVRCWRAAGQGPRVKVEHVQSGEEAPAATLEAALTWIGARCMEATGQHPATSDKQEHRGTGVALTRALVNTRDEQGQYPGKEGFR